MRGSFSWSPLVTNPDEVIVRMDGLAELRGYDPEEGVVDVEVRPHVLDVVVIVQGLDQALFAQALP